MAGARRLTGRFDVARGERFMEPGKQNGDIYRRLGVRRRINAAGTLTRLGGARMAPPVIAAMAAAADAAIDMAELQVAASGRIAAATGAEAGLVTTGAAAGLALAAAACLTGWNVQRMASLPDTSGFPNQILLPRLHRTGYSRCLAISGARLVDIGHNDRGSGAGVRGLEEWEIEAAIGPGTAAFAFSATPDNVEELLLAVSVCRPRGIPVIVDAAAQLPPRENLRRFIACGADLVVFSGGKAIGGPQASGILAGRRHLVGAALVQQIDMDVSPATWDPPELIDRAAMRGLPHHGFGRGFKAGKEEIAGLLVALELFVEADAQQIEQALERRLLAMADALKDCKGVYPKLLSAAQTGRVPLLELGIDPARAGLDAPALSRRLQKAEPPVHLSERLAARGRLIVDPQALAPDEDMLLVAAVRRCLPGS